ncbi:2Fe-2S iron-sulfur cluster-binding protein [Rariglobus hedericola]|uniref:nitric oxide dioxygenase n=1 Tax=Rariglobus hedericola TaxID=2597822 RepID=A0A556QL68_9BACT|nr:2Fe-2S iron-sulfur cluster-binding protein [Rariglobus hedericola]TSJ77367.1 2Fe-2S iron-sulfur cluster binding domain-containing protein [Rariglobus hedericola]
MWTDLFTFNSSHPAQIVGWVIVGGIMVQVGCWAGGGVRRYVFDRRRIRLEQERLTLDIHAARLRIQSVELARSAWNGIRKFTVSQKVFECDDTYSFYLKPHDGKPLPSFKPGQYLTFQLTVPGSAKPVIRCYSLSDCARPTHYRVTIKRCPPPAGSSHPPGIGSSFFCDSIKEGDILDVKAPNGHFFLDLEKPRPVVLISGGVGVTPMVSMANALIEAGDNREIWFFFGARNSRDHMFKDYMAELVAKHPHARIHVCYSKPLPADVHGRDYHHESRVNVALFKELLPSNNYDYFLCGPGPFMESITDDLRAWGVPDSWVHYEAFGPASVKKAAPPEVKKSLNDAPVAGIEVTFSKSGITAIWDSAYDSLLDLAESRDIKIDAGCRAGNCGSCLVAVKSGEVEYLGGHGADAEKGSCLTCICKPKGKLVIDA